MSVRELLTAIGRDLLDVRQELARLRRQLAASERMRREQSEALARVWRLSERWRDRRHSYAPGGVRSYYRRGYEELEEAITGRAVRGPERRAS